MISQSRWDEIIEEVVGCMEDHCCDHSVTNSEFSLVMSVLKSNTPFQVVPDFVANKTPNEVTVAAMNAEESQEISSTNVLLETKHFKVLGDKE